MNSVDLAWYRKARLWVAPTVGAGVALLLGGGMLVLDALVLTADELPIPTFVGEPDTVRALFQTVATAIATLTALVLTIVTVVVQLASGLYSHRALRTLLNDLHSHVTLATFVGTFTYALLGLLAFEATIEPDDGMVVGLTVPVAFVLGVVSIGVFVSYIDHIVHRARGTTIIAEIGDRTRGEIERQLPVRLDEPYPFPLGHLPETGPTQSIVNEHPGVVLELDVDRMVEVASDREVVLALGPAIGDFIPGGVTLLDVFGGEIDPEEVVRAIEFDPERTISQDVAFGIRLLVDVAEHAVSPSTNDPTTAVQCLDQVHDLLRRIAGRHLHSGWYADGEGVPRLFVAPLSWDAYVELACTEIRHYGGTDLQVVRRLRAMLVEILSIAPPERREALEHQIDLLDDGIGSDLARSARDAAMIGDEQGLGSRPTRQEPPDPTSLWQRSRPQA